MSCSWCECGQPASRAGVCDECQELDGRSHGEQLVIYELRMTSWATVEELRSTTELCVSAVHKILQRLEKRGRVRRAIPDIGRGGAHLWTLTLGARRAAA